MNCEGNILKLKSEFKKPIQYSLPIGESLVALNPYIGKKLSLNFKGQINCIATGQKIKKTYNQGYSYQSFISLARCDICILKPELCHFEKGTCREPEWGKENCFIPHHVYLSLTSGIKVGITRQTQVPTRWIDQGASHAISLAKVSSRLESGKLEVFLKDFVSDKTNWRKMLKGEKDSSVEDLLQKKEEMMKRLTGQNIVKEFEVLGQDLFEIQYPIEKYPSKLKSLSFDKTPHIEGILTGIKGQYLIFDTGVLNIRKHQGYYLYLKVGD